MNRRKQKEFLSKEIEQSILTIVERYAILSHYLERKLLDRELISTAEIVEKYFVSRHTVYRLEKSGKLPLIIKHRTLYFDAADTRKFFDQYWRKNLHPNSSKTQRIR